MFNEASAKGLKEAPTWANKILEGQMTCFEDYDGGGGGEEKKRFNVESLGGHELPRVSFGNGPGKDASG